MVRRCRREKFFVVSSLAWKNINSGAQSLLKGLRQRQKKNVSNGRAAWRRKLGPHEAPEIIGTILKPPATLWNFLKPSETSYGPWNTHETYWKPLGPPSTPKRPPITPLRLTEAPQTSPRTPWPPETLYKLLEAPWGASEFPWSALESPLKVSETSRYHLKPPDSSLWKPNW